MEVIRIWLLCIAAAVFYGIAHDQVTARVCVEYFTQGHPAIFGTTSPTLLALGWGTIASWWMGAILGYPLVIVMRLGSGPKLDARNLLRPLGVLLAGMALCALAAGVAGYLAASAGPHPVTMHGTVIPLPAGVAPRFEAVHWAHRASYAGGAIGGIMLWVWAYRARHQRG